MSRRGLGLLLLALGLPLWACGGGVPVVTSSEAVTEAERGRTLYRAYCSSCHGEDARGDGPAAAGLVPPPADLTRIAARNGGLFIRDAVASMIDGRRVVEAHGPRQMPVWGRQLDDRNLASGQEFLLTQDMIGAIVEYLRTAQEER